jgi:hypothetical protein
MLTDGKDQPEAATVADVSGTTYCTNFRAIHPTRLAEDKVFHAACPSPFPSLANSLFTFMVQRENASYISSEAVEQHSERLIDKCELVTGSIFPEPMFGPESLY